MKLSSRLSKVIPSKRIRGEFKLTYELKGAQRPVNLLAGYYKIRRMQIVVDGRKVGNSDRACYDYDTYTAYFEKRTIGKRLFLHEFYHHLAHIESWNMSEKREEKEADKFANELVSCFGN